MPPPTAEFEGKKILIVLHGSIGDVTRALPLAVMLRRKFPRAFLAWSIEPACFPLLQGNQAVGGRARRNESVSIAATAKNSIGCSITGIFHPAVTK